MNRNDRAAAFYDLEGTLVSTNLVHTLGFYAQRQQGVWQTVKKSAETLAKLPFFGITDLYSRNVFNEVFFKSYEGFSQDRLRYFSDELFEEVLKPAIYDGTPELIAQGKREALEAVKQKLDSMLTDQSQTTSTGTGHTPGSGFAASGTATPSSSDQATKIKSLRDDVTAQLNQIPAKK